MRVDITSHSNFEAAFEKCFELYGGIDVLVNCAGLDGEIDWEAKLQINFFVSIIYPSILSCYRAFFKTLILNDRLITIISFLKDLRNDS